MKKNLKSLILSAVLILASATVFAASKKSIVCTTYPEYDWIMNILGGKASSFSVTLLQNKGTDLHSYQPSFRDIAAISTCDMFVYVGGESDGWVEKALENSKNKNQIAVNMMEALGDRIREEEIVEGMQTEAEEDDEGEDGPEYDEHIWLSVKNAVELTKVLSEKIQKLDSANSSIYERNAAAYVNSLSALDSEYEKMISGAARKTVLFGDRYPFRYLSDDYGLKYYAAFVGCSAESEASFDTILFLASKVDELGLNAILTIEKGDKKIAQTISRNSKKKDQKILVMDSLQSVTEKDIKTGRTYLSAMKNNLEVLRKALN